MMSILLSCFVLLFLALTSKADSTGSEPCYWANGTRITDNSAFACSDGNIIQCCLAGSACMNNGLCFDPGAGKVYRGGCTISDWVAQDKKHCPNWCPDANGGWGPSDVVYCDQVAGNAQFWCSNTPTDPSPHCQSPLYAWPPPLGGQQPTIYQLETNSTSANSSSNSTTGTAKCTSNNGLAIGAGVGIPLGLLVIGLLTFLFMHNRRKRNVEAHEIVPGYAYPYYTTDTKAPRLEMDSNVKPAELSGTETGVTIPHHPKPHVEPQLR